MDQLLVEHAKARAMKAVMDLDQDFVLRQIQRWYSHEFATPLANVQELDTETLLQNFFENKYAKMNFEERVQEIREILQTPEEARAEARALDEQQAEEALFKRIIEANEEKKATEKALPKKLEVKPLPGPERPLRHTLPEASLEATGANNRPILHDIPEDVKVVFVTEEELLREAEGLGTMQPPSKP